MNRGSIKREGKSQEAQLASSLVERSDQRVFSNIASLRNLASGKNRDSEIQLEDKENFEKRSFRGEFMFCCFWTYYLDQNYI